MAGGRSIPNLKDGVGEVGVCPGKPPVETRFIASSCVSRMLGMLHDVAAGLYTKAIVIHRMLYV